MSIDYEFWLASNSLLRSDRRRYEAEYAALCANAAQQEPTAPAPGNGYLKPGVGEPYEHFWIDGPPAFNRATKTALGLLRGTPGWPWLRYVTRIGASEAFAGAAGGWSVYTEIEFPQSTWRDLDARQYAGSIAHESVHASGVDGSGDGEAKCRAVEAQVLRALGMPTGHLEW